ncbi:hypothetical protein CLV71_11397 [Actinophytocola oryzae]|uniref:Uncharacterized protein n=1 Tax=Actinophytocola oryzae TaxID=502181 RepID=A0A4R7V5T2_9PSEU|nr:hypothetical protein CLV71_11397 [Actinophytocola oryzae]
MGGSARRFTYASGSSRRSWSVDEGQDPLRDEDSFILPDGWEDRLHPRRGGRFSPPLDSDPERAWRLVDEFRDKTVGVIERRGGNGDPRRAHLPRDPPGHPLRRGRRRDHRGVGARRAFRRGRRVRGHLGRRPRAGLRRAGDHGAPALHVYKAALQRHTGGLRLNLDTVSVEPTAGRLRAHLAEATDDEHAPPSRSSPSTGRPTTASSSPRSSHPTASTGCVRRRLCRSRRHAALAGSCGWCRAGWGRRA